MSDTQTNLELVNTKKLHIVVVVRYKPSPKAMEAGSMLDGVASAAKSVSDAVDQAMSYIPGVFQEQTHPLAPLDDDYNYHESYPKHWDKVLKETENTLKEMDEKNKYILFEYDNNEKLSPFVSLLETQVKADIAPLKEEIYGIHFIGLAQGGIIAAEVAKKIKSSLDKDGSIDSLLCLGTALKGDEATAEFLKTIPNMVNYKSIFDFSSNVVLQAKEPEKLITTIKQANQTPIKYMYTMLVAKITKIVSQLLNGLTLGTSNGLDPLKNLIENIKGDVKSIIEDVIKFAKHIISSFKSFLKLPKLDQKFDEVFGNVDGVFAQSLERLKHFLKVIEETFVSGVKKGSLNLKDLPIEKLFNFLTPPVLMINNAFHALTIDLNDAEPANELKEFTAEGAFEKPIMAFDTPIATKDPYQKVVLEAAKEKEFDQVSAMIATAKQDVVNLGDKSTNDIQREQIGISLSRTLMLPMLSSKIDLLSKLMKQLPSLDNNTTISKIKSDTITAPLVSLLGRIRPNFDFDNTNNGNEAEMGLKVALAKLDVSICQIKEMMQPNYFKVDKQYNSLHFIYNSHNIAMAEMPKELRKKLDMATNIYQTKLAKGFEYNEADGTYKPGKDGIKTEEVLVVVEAKEKEEAS